MKFTFAGQTELSERAAALAMRLVQAHHQVTVLGAPSRLPDSVRNVAGVKLQSIPSFTGLSFLWVWWQRPDVVHISSWRLAALAPLWRKVLPETTLVWTVEAFPAQRGRRAAGVAQRAEAAGVEIVATSREIQWRLLTTAQVRARYIPDGYEVGSAPALSCRRWGLWKGRYVAVVANTRVELAWVLAAHKKTGSRRKLVVISEPGRNLPLHEAGLQVIETSSQRVQRSLMASAALVVISTPEAAGATILAAMEAGRPVVATAVPRFEEILGVTAQFVADGDEARLHFVLRETMARLATPRAADFAAQRRARAHFGWDRIFAEYLPCYQAATYVVPLDSAQLVNLRQPALH